MKRKIIATTLTMVGIFVIGISILLFLGVFKSSKAGILIESDPIAMVYINNEQVGNTPYEADLLPEEIIIKIKPESQNGQILDDYETKINLVSGVQTIIKKSFKENEEDSEGVTVSFEKVGNNDSFVTVVSTPDNAQVAIDDKIYGYTPLRVTIPAGDHSLLVRAENYQERKLPIRVYKGYKLTAFVKLAKKEVPKSTHEPVLANVTEIKERIKINKTDVGFLRVRSGASTGFPEVAQVKPDEVYDVIEDGENGSWYKIQLQDEEGLPAGRKGWVSAEFVTRIYMPTIQTP